MSGGPVAALSSDGLTLHLQHGPTDLIITADGSSTARTACFARARAALDGVIEGLVGELAQLRQPAASRPRVRGAVARLMVEATANFEGSFVTPMASVAGAIADHVLAASWIQGLERLTVNNGGDIAFELGEGATTTIGVVTSLLERRVIGSIVIHAASPVRGVATSGWRGRSFSLGIADAVTVLARNAALADAAASVIASAVDLPGHPGITRVPARELDESSDLGDRLVTRDVGPLGSQERRQALEPGIALAEDLLHRGVIAGAHLVIGDTHVSLRHESDSDRAPLIELGTDATRAIQGASPSDAVD